MRACCNASYAISAIAIASSWVALRTGTFAALGGHQCRRAPAQGDDDQHVLRAAGDPHGLAGVVGDAAGCNVPGDVPAGVLLVAERHPAGHLRRGVGEVRRRVPAGEVAGDGVRVAECEDDLAAGAVDRRKTEIHLWQAGIGAGVRLGERDRARDVGHRARQERLIDAALRLGQTFPAG